jgi:thiosulfate dehydrogenase [quinone] large subunit
MNNKIHYSYSNIQLTFLVILRVLIGWYFLYEGLAKVFTPNWTAFGYILTTGTPEEIVKSRDSYTAVYLREELVQ